VQIGRLIRFFAHSTVAVLMWSASATMASAQAHDDHGSSVHPQSLLSAAQQNALVKAVRDATSRFERVTSVAGPGEGYELAFGCVSGGEFGAMGMHYVNMALVGDGDVDVNQPEIVLFEPTPGGGIRITGADYLVYAVDWDAKHTAPPAFYTLHVWAWKNNPNGTFVNWNPDVSCDAYNANSQTSSR
jgi:hypothetical protein